MKRWHKAPGRAGIRRRPFARPPEWPDPYYVPSVALRRIQAATTIEEAHRIADDFLPRRRDD